MSASARVSELLTIAAAWLAHRPGGAAIAFVAFALAGVLLIPLAVLAAITFAVFGAWPGLAIAWLGGALSAALSHLLGGRLGRRGVAWLSGRLGRDPGPFLRRHGFWSGVVVRLLPGNFGAANLLAGAVGIPRAAFLLGNLLGLAIELAGLGVVLDRVAAAVRRPSPARIAGAVVVVVLAVAAGVTVRRWLRARGSTGDRQ